MGNNTPRRTLGVTMNDRECLLNNDVLGTTDCGCKKNMNNDCGCNK